MNDISEVSQSVKLSIFTYGKQPIKQNSKGGYNTPIKENSYYNSLTKQYYGDGGDGGNNVNKSDLNSEDCHLSMDDINSIVDEKLIDYVLGTQTINPIKKDTMDLYKSQYHKANKNQLAKIQGKIDKITQIEMLIDNTIEKLAKQLGKQRLRKMFENKNLLPFIESLSEKVAYYTNTVVCSSSDNPDSDYEDEDDEDGEAYDDDRNNDYEDRNNENDEGDGSKYDRDYEDNSNGTGTSNNGDYPHDYEDEDDEYYDEDYSEADFRRSSSHRTMQVLNNTPHLITNTNMGSCRNKPFTQEKSFKKKEDVCPLNILLPQLILDEIEVTKDSVDIGGDSVLGDIENKESTNMSIDTDSPEDHDIDLELVKKKEFSNFDFSTNLEIRPFHEINDGRNNKKKDTIRYLRHDIGLKEKENNQKKTIQEIIDWGIERLIRNPAYPIAGTRFERDFINFPSPYRLRLVDRSDLDPATGAKKVNNLSNVIIKH